MMTKFRLLVVLICMFSFVAIAAETDAFAPGQDTITAVDDLTASSDIIAVHSVAHDTSPSAVTGDTMVQRFMDGKISAAEVLAHAAAQGKATSAIDHRFTGPYTMSYGAPAAQTWTHDSAKSAESHTAHASDDRTQAWVRSTIVLAKCVDDLDSRGHGIAYSRTDTFADPVLTLQLQTPDATATTLAQRQKAAEAGGTAATVTDSFDDPPDHVAVTYIAPHDRDSGPPTDDAFAAQ